MSLQFANDVLKPWDELNRLVAQAVVFDPSVSDVSRLTFALANSINHTGDRIAVQRGNNVADLRRQFSIISPEYGLITDVSDMGKHFELRRKGRESQVSVVAYFEWQVEKGYRLIRNAIRVQHATRGPEDFLEASLAAINFLNIESGFNVPWAASVSEAPPQFNPEATLRHDAQHCINVRSLQIQVLQRTSNGMYAPCDPPQVSVRIV